MLLGFFIRSGGMECAFLWIKKEIYYEYEKSPNFDFTGC